MAARRKQTPKQRAAAKRNLRPQRSDEPGHNPTGRNGWTVLRERLGEIALEEGEDVYRDMRSLARNRKAPAAARVAASKLVLGPAIGGISVDVTPEAAKSFADIVKAASGVED